MQRILIIEDDPSVARGVQEALRTENFHVLVAEDAKSGTALARQENIDLLILDLILPDKRGEDILRDLRKEGFEAPVLVLSSKDKDMDKVLCLEMGADEYVTKPFSIPVLCSQVRALLRRKGDIRMEVDEVSFGNVYVDFKKQESRRGKKEIKLSTKEFEVLRFLVQHEGEVVSRDMLLNEVWGYENFPTTRTVDNYVLSLRKKLEEDHSHPQHLLTIHTSGYKFVK
jgi:DNA-binding response OmpR family regulator